MDLDLHYFHRRIGGQLYILQDVLPFSFIICGIRLCMISF